MGLLDEAKNAKPTTLGGTGTHFIDADTLANPNGPNYRLEGINSAEVAKILPDGTLSQGEAGGYESTQITAELANKLGYTNITPEFNPDGSPKVGHYGRQIADLKNDAGQSFSQELLKAGAYDPTRHSGTEDLAAIQIAEAQRNAAKTAGNYVPTDFDRAASLINQAELAEGARAQGFKQTALNEQERGLMINAWMQQHGLSRDEAIKKVNETYAQTTQIDNFDRNINNESTNPLSDSWDQGWIGAKEGAYGFLELLGETTGSEMLADIGTRGIERAQLQQAEYAHVLTDWKDVDGFTSGLQFLGNNAAMSLPYMAITTGAAIAGVAASPVIGGVAATSAAILAPASVYSGQVWNEMEGEKSASVALGAGLTQAALDRIGLGAITGKVLPKNLPAEAVKKIMKAQGISKEAAEGVLANATKAELAGFLKDSAAIATRQTNAKKIGMDLLKRAGAGGTGEAITEAGQEAIGYIAATQGSDKAFDWEELNERLIAASIAGGTLGVGFSTPGAIKNALAEVDLNAQQSAALTSNESQAALWAAEEKAELGYVPTVEENIANLHAAPDAAASFEDRALAGDATYKQKSLLEKTQQALLNPLGVLQGSVGNTINQDIQGRSRSARVLAGILGGNLQRVYGGASYENAKHHRTTQYKNMLPSPQQLFAGLSQGKRITKAVQAQLSDSVYSQLRTAIDAEGNFDPDLIADSDTKPLIVSLATQLNQLSNKMWADQAKYKKDLGFEKNYLFKYKAVNKGAIHKNRAGFAALLQSEYGYSSADAKELADRLADDPLSSDLGEAYSQVKGTATSGSHNERSLALSENPKFKEFMENDLYANLDQAAKKASRYTTQQQYLGNNNSNISKLLQQMQQEGLSESEVDKVAAGVRDFLDAESGNYKRPSSAMGKKLQGYQKFAMTYMTLAGLPLATISSFVEAALVSKSLTNDQIFGKSGSLRSIGTEGGKMITDGIGDIGNTIARRDTTGRQSSEGQKLIQELGYKDWDVGAGTVSGVTEINAHQQKQYQTFFKAIGLTQWTDMTRAARASMGGDYINAKIETLAAFEQDGEYTRAVQEAQEAIRNLGINDKLFLEKRNADLSGVPLSPEREAEYLGQWREGMFNWVNDAIALPQAANRPLIYQDPRFALFTQFQGFMSTFTANHIPKLWAEQVKRGTPAMKYSAFATMATMIMLGFLSQHLKDEIKYGLDDEEDETGSNPHLKTADYIRRGVFASGLLGTAERAISFIDPIYESRSDGAADWIFDTAVGESPGLSYVQRAAGVPASLIQGDVGGAAKGAVKSAPLFGPFSFIANKAEDWGDNLNFDGE